MTPVHIDLARWWCMKSSGEKETVNACWIKFTVVSFRAPQVTLCFHKWEKKVELTKRALVTVRKGLAVGVCNKFTQNPHSYSFHLIIHFWIFRKYSLIDVLTTLATHFHESNFYLWLPIGIWAAVSPCALSPLRPGTMHNLLKLWLALQDGVLDWVIPLCIPMLSF